MSAILGTEPAGSTSKPTADGVVVSGPPKFARRARPSVNESPRSRMSVRRRLALLFTIGTALSLVLCCSALFVVLDHQLSTAIDDGLRARLDDLDAVIHRTGGKTDDRDPFAQVVERDGRVIAWSPGDQPTRSELTVAQLQSVERSTFFDADVAAIGGDSRLLARPTVLKGRDIVLVVGSPLDTMERAQRGLALVLLVLAPLLTVAVASAGWWLAGAALRPVKEMTDEVNAITSLREIDRRLSDTSGDDEVGELGRTLNAMLGRIEQAVSHERAFVDDASHELRTPISILRGELELLRASVHDPAEVEQGLDRALDDVDRLRRLSERLLELSRVDAGQIDVNWQLVEMRARAVALARVMSIGARVDIDVAGSGVSLVTDADLIDQILTNLLTNAQRHAQGAIRVTVVAEGSQGARLAIEDDGPGFAESLLPVRFERFARGDASRARSTGGTGLGLAVTASLVSALGGTVTADNGSELGGARVVVVLPGRLR